MHLEKPGLPFTAGAAERVNRGADLNLNETGLFKHHFPACARQATGDSISPEIDVPERCLGHRLAVRDVGELQSAAGPQNAHDFAEHQTLVGA